MITKRCFKCGETKDLSEFYAHPAMGDGHLGKCKGCTKRDARANYANRRLEKMAYERERSRRPERRKAARGYLSSKDPAKRRANVAVGNALRDGRLVRQPCEVCGTTERVEAHHDDYSKPLDVRWFCFTHHREVAHGQVTEATARATAA